MLATTNATMFHADYEAAARRAFSYAYDLILSWPEPTDPGPAGDAAETAEEGEKENRPGLQPRSAASQAHNTPDQKCTTEREQAQ